MRERVAPSSLSAQGADADCADPVPRRERLAHAFPGMAKRFPAALDLTDRCLAAMVEEMEGLGEVLCEPQSPAKWRQALRGEKTMGLHTIARLALSGRPEARRA